MKTMVWYRYGAMLRGSHVVPEGGGSSPPPLPSSSPSWVGSTPPPPMHDRLIPPVANVADAGPFRRFLARTLDVMVAALLFGGALGLLNVLVGLAFGIDFRKTEARLVTAMYYLWLYPSLLTEVGIRAVCGNTPGKALLGLRVVDADGQRIGNRAYLNRNTRLWLGGYGLGIPLVNLVTVVRQFIRVLGRQPASYDVESCQRVIVHKRRGVLRATVGVLGVAAILCAIVFVITYDARKTREAAQTASQSRDIPWENPVTHRRIVVTGAWYDVTERTAKSDRRVDKPLVVFESGDRREAVFLFNFRESDASIHDVVRHFMLSRERIVTFDDGGRYSKSGAWEQWTLRGTLREGGGRVLAVFRQRADDVWLVLSVATAGAPEDSDAAIWLRDQLSLTYPD